MREIPRKRVVTRTITTTKVSAVFLRRGSTIPEQVTITIPKKFNSNPQLENYVKRNYSTNERRFAYCGTPAEYKTTYQMDETEFLRLAKVIREEKGE